MPIPPSVREPRQARSRETRRRLLDAAVELLVERGLSALSTLEVCRRAGFSQGALFKHYPTKALLVVATAERLLEASLADFRAACHPSAGQDDAADEPNDPVAAALRRFERGFRGPWLPAIVELRIAAHSDAKLAGPLGPLFEAHHEALRAEIRLGFPEVPAGDPDFNAFTDVLLSALHGRVLLQLGLDQPAAGVGEQVALYRLAQREVREARPPS